jgi:hypothetical protein
MSEKMTAEEVEAFAAYAKNGCDCVGCGLTRKASRHIAALESELREKKCEAAMPVTAREGLTAEELDVLLGSLGTWTAADVRAHIAALEAERDEWKAEAEMKHAALTDVSRALDETAAERNAFRNRMADLSRELDWLFVALSTPAGVGLREWAEKVVTRMEAAEERVKELERRDKHLVESASNLATERDRLASSLAAIRQRASDKSALGRIALLHAEEPRGVVAVHVTRYILGEDAPAQEAKAERPNPLHCCGTITDTHRNGCPTMQALAPLAQSEPAKEPSTATCGNCEGVQSETCATHHEPSTAEAFAEAKAAMCMAIEYARGKAALSLLEHRMGAMRLAIHHTLDLHGHDCRCGQCTDLRSSLTGAPEMYTREEIRGAFAHRADMDDHANVVLLEAMLERLATLRSK